MLLAVSMTVAPVHVGDTLPVLKGEFLTGKQALLPAAAKGKVALLALGFSYASRFQVEAWVGRFRKDFDHNSAVTFYEIPLIGGMARMGKWFIDSGMRKGTPVADQENVITVYGGVDFWKKTVNFRAADAAYLILIDQQGVVQWQHSGALDETAYTALTARTQALTGQTGK